MSRVERKRLEKEAKKKIGFFSKNKDNLVVNNENNIDKNVSDSTIVKSSLDIIDKEILDKTDNIEKNKKENNIEKNNEYKKIKKDNKNKIELKDRLNNSDEYFAKEIEKLKNNKSDVNIHSNSNKMMTADRIISVEDEQMIIERRKKNSSNSENVCSNILTVDDIFTAEDIENGNDKIVNTGIIDNKINLSDKEKNINEIKKLNIENAPFEDVVKVAESRLAAQNKEDEMKQGENSQFDNINSEKDTNNSENNSESIKNEDTKNNNYYSVDYDSIKDNKVNTDEKESNGSIKGIEKESNIEVDKKNSEQEMKKSEPEIKKIVKTAPINTEIYSVEEPEKEGKFKKFIKRFFGIVAILLVIVYAAGCIVFNGRFFPNTIVNGIDVSYKTPDELDKLASDKLNGYKLEIKGRNGVKDEILGSDVDLEYVKDSSSKNIKKEQGFLGWPLAFYSGEKIDGKLNVKYNEEKFSKVTEGLNIFKKENIKEPVSAFPDYDEKEKKVVVNAGDLGSTPINENVNKYISKMLVSEATSVKYDDSVYKPQKNTSSDPRLQKAIDEIQPYTNIDIEYNFEYEKYTATGKEIVKMFDVNSEDDYSVKLSKDKVREFVRNLSRKYSTYGDSREIPSASTGKTLKVSGGIYGWLIDREKETDELYKLLGEKKHIKNRTPIYAQTAISRDKNDMGNEFIEIDLSKQYMWYVKNGEVVTSTPIVSGQPGKGDATPTGIYPLNYKTRNATLRGPGYASPVSYWMPFNGNIGIHDANWQPYFGGSRYLYAGSHGCINTPYGKAAKFYSLAKEGMPVVVHH